MEDNPLVGIWSEDCRYGPGAQSDTVLILLPDRTGVLEDWNFVLCGYDTFTWSIDADGLLTLKGISSVSQMRMGR